MSENYTTEEKILFTLGRIEDQLDRLLNRRYESMVGIWEESKFNDHYEEQARQGWELISCVPLTGHVGWAVFLFVWRRIRE